MKLTCQMVENCAAPVARIDDKGFTYCRPHGATRKQWRPCRLLTRLELRELEAGYAVLAVRSEAAR